MNLINRVDNDQSVCARSASGCEGSIIAEAKRLYDIGLCPIPVRYVGDKCRRPAGLSIEKFDVWSPVEAMFHDFGRKHGIDALAVWIGQNRDGIVWLDIDSPHERNEWLRRASCAARELPRVRTRRGLHVVFRMKGIEIESRIDLRKYKFDGELLYGNQQIVIVPPSTHRSDNQVSYRWEVDLPSHVDKIPPMQLQDLITKLTENQLWKKHRETINCHPLGPSIPKASSARVRDQSGGGVGSGPQGSVRLALDRSMPQSTGQTRAMLPIYVRSLKRIRDDWSRYEVEEAARLWWYEANRRRVTRTSMRDVIELVRGLFKDYDPTKAGALADAIRFADQMIGDPIESMLRKRKNRRALERVAWVCYALALLSEKKEFWIACGDAARLCGSNDNKTGSRHLQSLIDDGVIEITKRGVPIRGTQATEYRFLPNMESGAYEQISLSTTAITKNIECIAVANY